jgi:hypothetical protein
VLLGCNAATSVEVGWHPTRVSVIFYQTTWFYSPDHNLHKHNCENLSSNVYFVLMTSLLTGNWEEFSAFLYDVHVLRGWHGWVMYYAWKNWEILNKIWARNRYFLSDVNMCGGVDSKGFWQCYIALRIAGFLDLSIIWYSKNVFSSF